MFSVRNVHSRDRLALWHQSCQHVKKRGPTTVPSPDRGYISLEEFLGLPQFWLLCRSHGVLRAFVAQSGKSELARSLSSGAKKDY